MRKLSIIVPCYNTEQYIEKCLDSIFRQKLDEFEVILIDDHSSDHTASIIKKYKKNHKNIKFIQNKENKGAGYNRNIALKEAKYDVISFIDSDDYLEDHYYEALFDAMEEEDADVAVCDIFIKYDASMGEADIRAEVCEGSVTKENLLNAGHAASPCNKLIKKELLEKYPFAEDIMNEDVASILAILVHAKKIAYTTNTYYNYMQRPSSVQNESLSFRRFDIFKALEILKERIQGEEKFKDYFDIIIYQQVIMFFMYVPPKEKNLFLRAKFLKEFSRRSKPYHIKQNHYLWNFLARQGKKHNIYYRVLLKCNQLGFAFLESLMISFYHFYRNSFVKPVIPSHITLETLVKLAKKQAMKKTRHFTISAVIPNYNYADFMYQRVYSILYQTEKVDELILLDDCSSDNSREVLDELEKALSPYLKIQKVYNKENSGSPFKQWKKGFSIATSSYVWIAEADDFCRKNFLKEVVKPILKDDHVVLSYTDTAFIDKEGKVILPSIKGEIDIQKTGHWDQPYLIDGKTEIKKYAYLNCTIANVSSVLFKKDDYKAFFKASECYRQAGDYLFYVNVMNKGKVAFSNKPYNFYRVHGNNVTSTTKKLAHLEEIKKVHKEIHKMYPFTKKQKEEIEKRYAFLKRVWNIDE